jgi:uncharacterized repeat protein (TIGR03803 family)
LLRDADGNLYGATFDGGSFGYLCPSGCRVVFKLDATAKETVLYTFTGGTDGAQPFAGLIRDGEGNLYGTTNGGGSYGWGTVFKVSDTGEETVLYSFTGGNDGGNPGAGVISDGEGNLYGTTFNFGAHGCGTVFKLSKAGVLSVLHSFAGEDGAHPSASLIQDRAGNLYGTAEAGGVFGGICGSVGCGVVFKITP